MVLSDSSLDYDNEIEALRNACLDVQRTPWNEEAAIHDTSHRRRLMAADFGRRFDELLQQANEIEAKKVRATDRIRRWAAMMLT